ncbi:hesA/moeB/thiF family protein [Staphylococcus aureus]|uniref:HesA/moeB/thiF family protein n=1 Tax=Staphylococcus aureus TaxID=1280 RepID=A0A380DUT0_STAAU|nr:hesA/moeB/thiF family protein [Staphylococcus aureus]
MAKIIRQKLKKLGIRKGIPVVFSDESPIVIREDVKDIVGDKNAINRKDKCHLLQMPLCQVLLD